MFKYQPGVKAYLEDAAIRQATGLLLEGKIPYAPQTPDEWGEVSSCFYSACLAARQTQIEYAQDVYRLWHAIWEPLPAPWDAAPPEPKDPETSLDPVTRWEESCFLRRFTVKSQSLVADLWVCLDFNADGLDDVELGFGVRKDDGTMLAASNLRSWRFDKDDENLRYCCKGLEYKEGLDLTELKGAAEQAMSVIKTKVNSRAK